MKTFKSLILALSLFTAISPISAMDHGDMGNQGFFGKVWNLVKEHPVATLVALQAINAAFMYKVYANEKRDIKFVSAARDGNLQDIKDALKAGVDINRGGGLALRLAAEVGHLEVVQHLVSNGADMTLKKRYEDNALFAACRNGHLPVVKYLIDCGLDITSKNDQDKSLLHVAIRHVDVVEFLIESGLDIHATDCINKTPLHYAAELSLPVVQLLIEGGANVNHKKIDGLTPLHCAIKANQLDIIKYLIESGADIEALSSDNQGLLACTFDLNVFNVLANNGALMGIKDEFEYLINSFLRADSSYISSFIQRYHFIEPNINKDESQKRIEAVILATKQAGHYKDISSLILAKMPEDLVSARHAKKLFNDGIDINELVKYCPLRWFGKLYYDTPDAEKEAFLQKVVPAITQYRLNKAKETFKDRTSEDPVIASIIDVASIEQQRAVIAQHVIDGILGIEEEIEVVEPA